LQETSLEEDEESQDQETFPSVILASPALTTNSLVTSDDPDVSSVGSENQGTRLHNSETSRVLSFLSPESDGNKISDQSSELKYSGFEPCKESTMLSQSQRPDIRRIKSKCKIKLPKTPQPNTETSEEEPDLRQNRHCLLDTTYLMNVTNRKQLDPPNKTLQMSTVDLFEDVDPEPRKFHD